MSKEARTEDRHFFPPSIGLLRMAAHLAVSRTGMGWNPDNWEDLGISSRKLAKEFRCLRTSREYYSILDRIARGVKP